jgi:hypothetical protein
MRPEIQRVSVIRGREILSKHINEEKAENEKEKGDKKSSDKKDRAKMEQEVDNQLGTVVSNEMRGTARTGKIRVSIFLM